VADHPSPGVLPDMATTVDESDLLALSKGIRERADEIGEKAVAAWIQRRGEAERLEAMEAEGRTVCRTSTMSVAQFIATGQSPSDESRRQMSNVGRAAANSALEFAEVTKIHLHW